MDTATRELIQKYINDNIDSFHTNRVARLKSLRLKDVLEKKNPYLFRAKNINSATDLVNAVLDARLSSSEEGMFGGFLEGLAIYVAEITCGGRKSAANGIDIELTKNNIRYLIAVKSGKNWGNSGQHAKLKDNFRTAVRILRQDRHVGEIQTTLGICYGRFTTINTGEFLHVGGQSFWHLISDDPNLYIDLIEPLGYKAEEHDKFFKEEIANLYNRCIREFTNDFCESSGAINWPRLVKFVSGNLPQYDNPN